MHAVVSWSRSLNQFDLAGPPAFIEERFERAVEAQRRHETLAGHRLDPIAALYTLGLLWRKVHRRRTVSVWLGGR